MGDFNWITPQFLAFASPQHQPADPVPQSSPRYAMLPHTVEEVASSDLPQPFQNVLCHFKERNVGLVVRLNSELYSPSYFTALGIEHLDMIFDDGTCPPLSTVRRFVRRAHDVVTRQRRGVAVHCKAGLGRTGCLIGAYLIYRHGFAANDLMAFLRFMRPGMVVGPQQHWLHLHQGAFRQWWWEDQYREKLAALAPSTPVKSAGRVRAPPGSPATPPQQQQHAGSGPAHGTKRPALEEIHHNEGSGAGAAPARSADKAAGVVDECLPAPTPGQPRKTSRTAGRRSPSGALAGAPTPVARPPNAHRASAPPVPDRDAMVAYSPQRGGRADAGWPLSSAAARSPPGKQRAISVTTTTTTTTYDVAANDDAATCVDVSADLAAMSDVENWTPHDAPLELAGDAPPSGGGGGGSSPQRYHKPARTTPASAAKGGALGVVKVRGSPLRRSADSREGKAAGVRKTSGRVGSLGTGPTAVGRGKSS